MKRSLIILTIYLNKAAKQHVNIVACCTSYNNWIARPSRHPSLLSLQHAFRKVTRSWIWTAVWSQCAQLDSYQGFLSIHDLHILIVKECYVDWSLVWRTLSWTNTKWFQKVPLALTDFAAALFGAHADCHSIGWNHLYHRNETNPLQWLRVHHSDQCAPHLFACTPESLHRYNAA